ncbi:amidohydrolase [Neobacillus drentensis]|uniref:amidohydrolase n=1 Tax=Neobacillus drentensis TaxID=220684 RepID=UPI001F413459|nr:amidohydrolase [Neobacillus drentensis]ULT58677.1 amidohydrolase [Neobacillus drentensis]
MNSSIKADIIITGDAVFTGLDNRPKPGAIAIIGNKIAAVGSYDEIVPYIGTNTQVYVYGNQLIMPGFHDFHLHIIPGAIELDSISLLDAKSEEEAADMVRQFADTRPEDPWILGFSWDNSNWDNKQLPTRASLDRVLPDRPVVLMFIELHYAWVNSKALEIMGITRDTPNPPFGEIEKDKNGELTGILYEKAMDLVHKGAYDFSREKKSQILKKFFHLAAEYGITSVNDMYAPTSDFLDDFELFRILENAGELPTRIHLLPALTNDLERSKDLRGTYTSNKLQFSGLKYFIDGVITGYTAYLLDPYSDKPETRGSTSISPELFKKMVINADREGFRIRIHAIGDAGVRLSLDAFEEAQIINGVRDSRHTIEHIESIHPDDINRFQQLGVIASMQPQHLALTHKEVYLSRLGEERDKLTFAVNTLKKAGARIAFGSDFPVTSLNPMLEIYRAVTRVDYSGSIENVWNPEEGIALAEALKAYTLEPAYGTFRENELGTIEVGKLADIIVLDRNLFDVPTEEIVETKVQLTVVDGKVVFEQGKVKSIH